MYSVSGILQYDFDIYTEPYTALLMHIKQHVGLLDIACHIQCAQQVCKCVAVPHVQGTQRYYKPRTQLVTLICFAPSARPSVSAAVSQTVIALNNALLNIAQCYRRHI